jgi:hypothetical protein
MTLEPTDPVAETGGSVTATVHRSPSGQHERMDVLPTTVVRTGRTAARCTFSFSFSFSFPQPASRRLAEGWTWRRQSGSLDIREAKPEHERSEPHKGLGNCTCSPSHSARPGKHVRRPEPEPPASHATATATATSHNLGQEDTNPEGEGRRANPVKPISQSSQQSSSANGRTPKHQNKDLRSGFYVRATGAIGVF